MAKTQTATKQAPAQLSFLAQLAQMATPATKARENPQASPVERMRAKFEDHANDQIKMIEGGATKGRWFYQNPIDKSYTLALRNGNTAMALNGASYFHTPNRDAAIKFLQTAVEAAKSGEMDEAFMTSQRKKPEKAEA